MTLVELPTRTVLLDAYAARSCPVKTHNTYDPTVEPVAGAGGRGEVDTALAGLLDGRARFEAVVLDTLIRSCRGLVVDLRLLVDQSWEDQTGACVRALSSGAAVVIGGLLPADPDGHRVGRPALLVRGADTDGRPAYHPVEVKGHKILDRSRRPGAAPEPPLVRWSLLSDPAPEHAAELNDHMLRFSSRETDFLQLAHYVRLLQAADFAPHRPLAAVIGTDALFPTPVLAWADLSEPAVRTFSRSDPEGWRLRSPLERYDYEHAFRVDIAAVAAKRSREPDDPAPLVRPVVNVECARCPWWEHCRRQLHPDDVSLRIDKGALDRREITTLRRLGVVTISDLVGADLDELLPSYLPEVTHRCGAELRLRTAFRRAGMLLGGVSFSRETTGPVALPDAATEIDFDIESSADGRIYLWGFLLDSGTEPASYSEFSRFDDLDDASETALALEALEWLRGVVDSATSIAVYHYSGYEVARIRELAARTHSELLDWAVTYAEEHFVDLLEVVKTHFFGVNGLGLKLIARHAGFHWRDDDPGGLNSQRWFAEAVHSADPDIRAQARTRVLEYNEDDVIATHHLRAWLREQ